MALSVQPINPGKITSVGNNNGGMQGSTYNPQQTAPAQVIQPTYNPQPATYNPQTTVNSAAIQAAATAAAVARAAEAQRQAVEAEAARQRAIIEEQLRQKKIRHDQADAALKTITSNVKSALTLKVAAAPKVQGSLRVAATPKQNLIGIPVTDYERRRNAAYDRAMAMVDADREPENRGFFGNLVDDILPGYNARSGAQKRLQTLYQSDYKGYEDMINIFTSEQAKRYADLQAKAVSGKYTEAQFNQLWADYEKWQNGQVATLQNTAADLEGMSMAFEKAGSAPLHGGIGGALSWVNRNVVNMPVLNWIGRHTLGQGDENIPSLVTLPGRAVNWLGNLNTPDRVIQKEGGETENRLQDGKNAWQATFNQRQWNLRPYVDKPFDKAAAYDALKNGKTGGSVQQTLLAQRFKRAKDDAERDAIAKEYWDEMNRSKRNINSAQDLLSDPLILAGPVVKTIKAIPWVAKAEDAIKASAAGRWVAGAVEKASSLTTAIKENTVVKWLGSDFKTAEQKLGDTIELAKNGQKEAQARFFDRINTLNKKLAGEARLDTSVIEELGKLTDSEAKILQRMTDGKLAARDRLLLAGANNAPIRQKLEDLAVRWTDFTEKMKLADAVDNTRFGAGKKTYSPRTAWLKDGEAKLDDYNFRLRKKYLKPQSASDLHAGAIDRYFKSNVDEIFAGTENAKRSRWLAERSRMLSEYDKAVEPLKEGVQQAKAKVDSSVNKIRRVAGMPLRLWKDSVLARPAWTTNNILWNVQSSVMAGGADALAETAKILTPSRWRKAMNGAASLEGNLAADIGTRGNIMSKWYKFNSSIENTSRVGTYKALIKQGLTHDEALARVNKFFFDYSTKNWERPLKTIIPFWSWQKNIAKLSATLPFTNPIAAKTYNSIDRYQQQQYDREFDTTVPKLKELGYTDAEIEQFRKDNAKYFAGRLNIGNKWITTPFNAFSSGSFKSAGFNPFIAALSESAASVDSFGQSTTENSLTRRIISKFPQAELALQAKRGYDISTGKVKPERRWIGAAGHEGYGLGKVAQGSDPTAENYDPKLDPRNQTWKLLSSFLGQPSTLEFNKDKFIQAKTMQKVTDEYFKTDFEGMDYSAAESARQAIFKKYGITADDFYKGVLAKYDSDNTKRIKDMKSEAAAKNKSLFEEYAAQPKGTRNVWATQKLRELVSSGYFENNPFLKSFEWINPGSVKKADNKMAYDKAKSTGDWSAFAGNKPRRQSPYQYAGKFFKSQESMDAYKRHEAFTPRAKASPEAIAEAKFWTKYAAAGIAERRKLLADNPTYNHRKDWTQQMWDDWKAEKKKTDRANLRGWMNIGELVDKQLAENKGKQTTYRTVRASKRRQLTAKWLQV